MESIKRVPDRARACPAAHKRGCETVNGVPSGRDRLRRSLYPGNSDPGHAPNEDRLMARRNERIKPVSPRNVAPFVTDNDRLTFDRVVKPEGMIGR